MIRHAGLNCALNIYRAAIQLGLTVALAHFLTPADFGLVALLLPIALFLLLIGDLGMTGAIISRPPAANAAGAAATLCLTLGIAVPIVMLALYSAGALAFMPASMATLLLGFGVVTMLAMAAIVPRALLESRLLYGRITGIETVASMLGFGVAIGGAAWGAGAWSFALYHLAMQAVRATGFGLAARRHFQLSLDWRLARPLLHLGGWIAAFNIVNFLMRNLDRYVVGAWLGADALGLYAFAYQIMLLPLMVATWPVSAVLVATLGRLAQEPAEQRETFLAALTLTSCVTLPAMTFVALFHELLFAALLPARWAGAAGVTGVMAVAGGLQSITAFTGVLFLTQGRVKAQFWMGLGIALLTLGTLAACVILSRSLIALALAYALLAALLAPLYLAVMARLLRSGAWSIAARLVPALAASMAAGAIALGIDGLIMHLPTGIRLLVDIVIFVLVMAVVLLLRRATFERLFIVVQDAGRAARPAA